jgi:hypothetical protein
MNILGLDVSTRIIGYTVMTDGFEVLECDYIDLSKIDLMIDKAEFVYEQLKKIKNKYDIGDVAIEECVSKFAGGRSSIKTISKLFFINILTQYQCFRIFNVYPTLLNVRRARNLADIKVNRGDDSKEVVFGIIKNRHENIGWPKMKRDTTRFSKECFDMADSVVVSHAMLRESKVDE